MHSSAEILLDKYEGNLFKLREAAGEKPETERKKLQEIKGLAKVGINSCQSEASVISHLDLLCPHMQFHVHLPGHCLPGGDHFESCAFCHTSERAEQGTGRCEPLPPVTDPSHHSKHSLICRWASTSSSERPKQCGQSWSHLWTAGQAHQDQSPCCAHSETHHPYVQYPGQWLHLLAERPEQGM